MPLNGNAGYGHLANGMVQHVWLLCGQQMARRKVDPPHSTSICNAGGCHARHQALCSPAASMRHAM